MPCHGVIIVAGESSIEARYQEKLLKMDKNIQGRIIVASFDGLSKLKTKYFGILRDTPGKSLEKTENLSRGRFPIFPINSTKATSDAHLNTPIDEEAVTD